VHVKNFLSELGVNDRTAAVPIAFRPISMATARSRTRSVD